MIWRRAVDGIHVSPHLQPAVASVGLVAGIHWRKACMRAGCSCAIPPRALRCCWMPWSALCAVMSICDCQASAHHAFRFQPMTQVDEVKNIMVDNIEKVLERGEKIELLVDKTDNLRFQVGPVVCSVLWLQGAAVCGRYSCMLSWLGAGRRGSGEVVFAFHPDIRKCTT